MPLTKKEFEQLATAIFYASHRYIVGRGLTNDLKTILSLISKFTEHEPTITIVDKQLEGAGVSLDWQFHEDTTPEPKIEKEPPESQYTHFCAHTNEVPNVCCCDKSCVCKENSCKDKYTNTPKESNQGPRGSAC